ncbi:ribonucleoside-diphosphate reductase, adenosylcobalamin-dependent [Desulfonatronospira thiodismutans ASO3-1]|uniref:Vitamin B12-dependent ribonucleotide reductase n=1 Tax=Desulfonatronospira thiodismutans ASO3-1 TaxID=555779 RepID=D6SNX9_9BACT|nr:vitamin B12-dependent ribonucleotide reductase [Desulfonatronospira thiodismutans]EFI34455.1 ribonucleoside-diphosphate reductase, adenosylcobalamin-dependent [Desulfonatronospira thiodismutans ASO3-1]
MKIMPMPQDLPEPVLTPNAKTVLSKRYLRKGDDGQPLEDFKTMFWRVAASVAGEEDKYQESSYNSLDLGRSFYQLLVEGKFLPNSPTLMNAGTDLGQLAACFVLPVGDSMDEIFDSIKNAALIHKSGGGTGFSFSRLRPKDSRVGSTGGIASGPLSFLKIFNTATEQVKQGGTRRGANMGILRVDHPDIMDFIRAKERDGELNNFNLSVALTEKFMQSVESGSDYSLTAPQNNQETERLNAREVFSLLVHKAWESGDPGIIFLDRINKDNPTPGLGEMESTNPCGEQPLLPYEACNLGSINLDRFYSPTAEGGIDWEGLREAVHLSVRFLDNVIDLSRYPLERITEMVHKTRKIGLGVMGFADLLFQLRVAYDSHRGLQLGEKIMEFVQRESRSASRILAQERGPFPEYEHSIYARQNLGPYRNATTTTIAPTGTLSIIAGCSSGIEPIFALSFTRQVLDGERLLEVNPHLEEALKNTRSYSDKLMEDVAKKGSIKQMEHLDQDLRDVFVTAMDVPAQYHLKMQAAFQKYTDNAVSKTVNLPFDATQEDVWQIYWMAYEMGCKGVTVYRDGCRAEQVLSTQDGEKARQDRASGKKSIRERPEVVYGFTQKVKTGLGELYLTVNEVDGKPFEVFATIGRSGRSITAKAEAIGRLVSLALRSGIDVKDVVKQIKGIGGEHPVFQKKGLLLSIPDAVGWVLENRYLQGHSFKSDINGLNKPSCPECAAELLFQEGCFVCQACGYTKCG